jgi:hypothetical protein
LEILEASAKESIGINETMEKITKALIDRQ